MDYNPLSGKLSKALEDRDNARKDLKRAESRLSWYDTYDSIREKRMILDLEKRIVKTAAEVEAGRRDIAVAETRREELKGRASKRKGFLGWGGRTEDAQLAHSERSKLKDRIGALRTQVEYAESSRDDLVAEHARAKKEYLKHQACSRVDLMSSLSSCKSALARAESRLSDANARKVAVDSAIAPLIVRIVPVDRELDRLQEQLERVGQQIDAQFSLRDEAFTLNDRIKTAANSYERALLHQESERRFGNGKPGAVGYECRQRIELLRSEKSMLSAEFRSVKQTKAQIIAEINQISRSVGGTGASGPGSGQSARAWIRLAQMEAYLDENRAPVHTADWNSKSREAKEFRSRLTARGRPGRRTEDLQWWGGRVLSHGRLGKLTKIGGGGEGDVYHPEHYPGLLYKEYLNRDAVQRDALERLISLRLKLNDVDRQFIDDSAAWPAILVEQNGKISGFLMASAASRFFHKFSTSVRKPLDLSYLVYPAKPAWGALQLPSDRQRVEICRYVCRIVQTIHSVGGIVGDISMANILWSLAPLQAFLIDCDGVRVSGRKSVLPQKNTPHWVDPADEARATENTDCYKLAQVVMRVLTTSQYREPFECLPKQTIVPATSAKRLDALFARCGRATLSRPTASEWLAEIETLLEAM